MIYESVDASSNKPIIHFAHANSFPAASYRQFFEALSDDFQVLALGMFGHNAKYPVNKNWENQVNELIDFVSTNAPRPVISIGHSFGGVVAYKAACKRPDLFSKLVLLDPPIVTGGVARFFQLIKLTPLIDKLTPSGKSKVRTTQWSTDDDLIAYFSSRTLFRNMPSSVIQDYVNAAIVEREGRLQLTFSAEVETALFRNIPHDLSTYAGRLPIVSTLISAEYSDIYRPRLLSSFLKHNNIRHQVFPQVGHLFPLDLPIETAAYIKQIVA